MGCCCIKSIEQIQEEDDDLSNSKIKLFNESAQDLKQQGNKHFKGRLYQNAIKCYQRALLKNPKQIVYYTNLALAFKANKQYKQSIQTINRLLKLNQIRVRPDSQKLLSKGKIIKSRSTILLAKQYILKQQYSNKQTQNILQILDQTIPLLVQTNKNQQFQKEAEQYLKHSYKIKKYLTNLTKNMNEEQELKTYLNKKLLQEKNHKVNEQKWEKISIHYPTSTHILQQMDKYMQKQRLALLSQNEDEEYITDPITYQIFQSPVIVPSGLTYDELILKQHFKKNGYKDPITKQQYKAGQQVLVRNINLHQYILGTNQQMVKKEQIQLMVC